MGDSDLFIFGILQLIFNLLSPHLSQDTDIVLSMDRTNWKLGLVNINILMVGLVLDNGKFIPLYFELLDKRGNSSQEERKCLMDNFSLLYATLLSYIPTNLVLAGDREFIGKDWFKYLRDQSYEFVIRLRKTDYRELLAGQMNLSIEELDHKIRGHIESKGYFTHPLLIKGKTFYYQVTWAKGKKQDNDLYIRVLSTQNNVKWSFLQYDKRWKSR